MSKRKSIVASFSESLIAPTSPTNAHVTPSPEAPRRVGAGVIGATKRTLTDIREDRDRLQALIDAGTGLVELDASLIDPSPFQDRLPDDDNEAYEAFKQTLADEGQKVPVQVRKHPTIEGHYQTVFGHRRTRALRELGKMVRAIVVEYSDRDLVVAQGIENANRQDLSWSERALFAHHMREAGIKAKDIRAALSVDNGELSRFKALTTALPTELIAMIGRAPRIGRPRWLELVSLWQDNPEKETLLAAANKFLASSAAKSMASEERFKHLIKLTPTDAAPKKAKKPKKDLAEGTSFDLDEIGSVTFAHRQIVVDLEEDKAEAFKSFLEGELLSLLARFYEDEDKENNS